MYRLVMLASGIAFAAVGCVNPEKVRSQLDDESDKPKVRTIGDVTEFQTAGAVSVSGVGLVVGLDGTGGGVPAGPYRQLAEEFLKRNKVEKDRKSTRLNSSH